MDRILSFVVGVAAGAALGVLLAPASGSETRSKIREEADRLIEDALEYKRKVMSEAGELEEKVS